MKPLSHRFVLGVLVGLCPAAAFAQCRVFEDQILLAGDAQSGDWFGSAADVDGAVAVVGAPRDDDNGGNSGAAYVFRRAGGVWQFEQKLVAADGTASDLFGTAVGVSGNLVIVGAPGDSDVAPGAGSAYAFRFDGATWNQEQKLVSPETANGIAFGQTVAASGGAVLVGAPYTKVGASANAGAAYVFRNSGAIWSLEQKLTASDGKPYDYFAWSVALEGDEALVGAIDADGPAFLDVGAAYAFERSGASWIQQKKLVPSDGAADDQFGYSVALTSHVAVVGANLQNAAASDAGAVYVFSDASGSWTEAQKLVGHDSESFDRFGTRVSIDGPTLAVHAALDDEAGTNSGAVFVFRDHGAGYFEQVKIVGHDTNNADAFGAGLGVSGDTVLAGATVGGPVAGGAAYVIELPALSLDMQPDVLPTGTPFDLFVCGGVPAEPMAIVTTEIAGTPLVVFLFGGALGANGGFGLASVMPPVAGISGLSLSLRAFSRTAAGDVIQSADETVSFP